MQVVFTQPPMRQAHPWAHIAEQLKANPGEWALCLRQVRVSATRINRGEVEAFRPAGSFEARTTKVGVNQDGKPVYDLYIRYLGEPE